MKISIVKKFYENSTYSFDVRYIQGDAKAVTVKMIEEYLNEVKDFIALKFAELAECDDIYNEAVVGKYKRAIRDQINLADVIVGDIMSMSINNYYNDRDLLGIKNYSVSISEVEVESL